MPDAQLLLWIDKETDSLDVRDCVTLEAAGFMTTLDMHVLRGTEFHYLMALSADEVRMIRDTCDPIVREMHDKSGLWDALLGKTEGGLDRIPFDALDGRLSSMVSWACNQDVDTLLHEGETTMFPRPEEGYRKKPRIAGSGVAAFDVQIIRFQMPKLVAAIDYTSCDVSNIRRFLTDQCGVDIIKNPDRPHRAHEDILNAWKEAHIVSASIMAAYSGSDTGLAIPTFVAPEF